MGASPEVEAEAEAPPPHPLLSTNDRSTGGVVGVVGVVELLLAVGFFDFGNGWGDICKQVEEVVIVTAKKKYNAVVPVPAIVLLALCPEQIRVLYSVQ